MCIFLMYTGIGLAPGDAQFHILHPKIVHSFNWECTIYPFVILYLVYRWKLRTELVKITHKMVQTCAFLHIKIFSDIIPVYSTDLRL